METITVVHKKDKSTHFLSQAVAGLKILWKNGIETEMSFLKSDSTVVKVWCDRTEV
jgi:hypothetical protein